MDAIAHDRMVDAWIVEALGLARTLGDLVSALPGVYPTEVREGLRRIGRSLPPGPSEKLLLTSGPPPHPVDADWRFHPETEDYLVQVVRDHTARSVILLGCPSLADPLARVVPNVALIDRNPAWTPHIANSSARPVWADVSAAPRHWSPTFDVGIVDPPWYPAEIARFLTAAAAVVRPGGTVLLSWPAVGTRPGIDDEWEKALRDAELLGLRYLEAKRLRLRYATPFFEGAAMRAAGVPIFNGWRRGDLVSFVRDNRAVTTRQGEAMQEWNDARFGALDLRIRCGVDPGAERDPRLHPLVEGDVLPSVSRRDPRRKAAVVWTGGNRVFACARPDLTLAAVRGLSLGVSVAASVCHEVGRELSVLENGWCTDLERQIRDLETLEGGEYDALHENGGSPRRVASQS
jgi:hypothetical protein